MTSGPTLTGTRCVASEHQRFLLPWSIVLSEIGINLHVPALIIMTRVTCVQPSQGTHDALSRGVRAAYTVSKHLTEADLRTLGKPSPVLESSLCAPIHLLNQMLCT